MSAIKDAELYTAVNVEGTRHLLQAVRPRNLFIYRRQRFIRMKVCPYRRFSLAPQGAYEQSKLKAEDVCRSF